MFELREYDREANCQELTLDEGLFHRALESGDKRYHVRNPKGEDFDICYLDNNDDLEPIELYPAYIKSPYMAKYRVYDETDKETLYLEFLEGLRNLEFEETLYVQKRYASGLDGRGYNRMSFVYAFHNVFFLQWALNGGKFQRSYKFSIGIEQEN